MLLGGGQHADQQVVGIDIAWCTGCRAETTVETVTLRGDPGPVAVCLACGNGTEMGWDSAAAAAAGERPPRAS
jgi:hypothetical protein